MRIILAIAEGIFWSLLAIGLLWLTLPADFIDRHESNNEGFFATNFGRRWDGGCLGWTRSLASLHVVGDILMWSAYVIIAVVVARLHPIITRVRYSSITVPMISLVFVSCGASHLFDAYATFKPIYFAFGSYKILAGCIGIAGAVFIAHNLVTAFDIVHRDMARLKELEEKLSRR